MRRHLFVRTLGLLAVLLSACASAAPAAGPTGTPVPSLTAAPTDPPTQAASPTPEPPALPVPYQASLLNPLDSPHTYIPEPCQYIKDKWSSANSAPGTVVMVIMFHIITNDALANPDQISEFNFRRLMKKIYTDGFQAITTAQLAGFLYHNAKIPERSVLLVVDDRKTRQYFERFFQQYWDDYHWPVVNAWISTPLSTADLWQQQVDLEAAGWVDHQAHGVVHDIPIDSTSSDEYILGELQGSIDAFKLHFDKTPIAFIWPGGGFTPHAAALARQVGYQLGFTINPRGPLMYNWVPLADSGDPVRPTWIPEGPVNDPLMVLPRYWDTDAALHLDEVVQMSGEAAAYADQNKATEMEYYDIVCASQYGPIP